MPDTAKVTALTSSAATDDGQSPILELTPIIPDNPPESNEKIDYAQLRRRIQRANAPDYIHTVSLTELYDTVYRPKAQIIGGLLNSGTYLFAGAPKVGKSFFMAQLGYHVSSGIPLWDYPVHKGTVLYLALEDDYARLQKRLSRMFGTDNADRFRFATHAKLLNGGLDGQLGRFMREHPDTKMVIIDTLQKIREAGGGSKVSYSGDYEIVAKLKQFADQHNICILLVHHTRKQSADDSFDTISGTNGLLGAADGAFILRKDKRTDDAAVLDIVGRDQQDQRLHLEFDRERCVWQLTEKETDLRKEPPDPLLTAVSGLVSAEFPQWSGSASELAERLNVDLQPNVLTRRLNIGAERLWNKYGIRYESSRSHAGRIVKLTLDNPEA